MDQENFTQYTAGKPALGENAQWLKDGIVCIVTLWNGEPLLVTPPAHIELKVIETDPGLRGDTATGLTIEGGILVDVQKAQVAADFAVLADVLATTIPFSDLGPFQAAAE